MYRIAVVGDRDSIYGFSSAGLDIFPILNADEALSKIRHLAEENYAVIYVTENYYTKLLPSLEIYAERTLPAIIPIPGVSENTGIGLQQVKKSVEKAVGADILFYDK